MKRSEQAWVAGNEAEWARLHKQEVEQDVAEAQAHAATPEGRMEDLQKQADALRMLRSDSGLTPAQTAELAQIEAEIAKIRQDAEARFWAEWTPEVTRRRRAEWNKRVQAGEFGKIGSGQINYEALRAAEMAQGWTANDLKRAVKRHG